MTEPEYTTEQRLSDRLAACRADPALYAFEALAADAIDAYREATAAAEQRLDGLRAALERLTCYAEAAGDCYYGGAAAGCDHAPLLRDEAALARRALSDTPPPASPRQGEPVEPGPATKIAAEIDRARQMIEDGRGGPMSGEYRAGFLAALAALRDEFASWDPRLAALSEPAEAAQKEETP